MALLSDQNPSVVFTNLVQSSLAKKDSDSLGQKVSGCSEPTIVAAKTCLESASS